MQRKLSAEAELNEFDRENKPHNRQLGYFEDWFAEQSVRMGREEQGLLRKAEMAGLNHSSDFFFGEDVVRLFGHGLLGGWLDLVEYLSLMPVYSLSVIRMENCLGITTKSDRVF
ncbi:hypothetical protein L1S32_05515 [Methanogenium sp. S4BF]|uniref:hypothetical protein n=1 Tax=Methanogenium sp. S4BF TaxID=1789226 RepID=UPI00241749E3|nr:hypothetical protein [Methanogenium sp. S4BF]WFN35558.1 hypothetical protein L1S32_05515 [Methanogenium sp. S4BF]